MNCWAPLKLPVKISYNGFGRELIRVSNNMFCVGSTVAVGTGVLVGLGVGSTVAVGTGVFVGSTVAVGTGVLVGSTVGVGELHVNPETVIYPISLTSIHLQSETDVPFPYLYNIFCAPSIGNPPA